MSTRRSVSHLLLGTLVTGLALLMPAHASAQKVLRYKFQEGSTQDMQLVQVMEMTNDALPQPITMKQEMSMHREVQSVADDGSARIAQQIQRIKLASEAANLMYDSESKDEPRGLATAIAPLFEGLTKSKVQVTMTPLGEINDVELPQELLDAASKAPQLPGISEMLSKDGMMQMMRQSGLKFPVEPVKEGTSWTDKLEMNNAAVGKQVVTTTYTYLGQEEAFGKMLEKIGVKTDIKFEGSPPGVQMKVTDQKSDGYILFDNEAGDMVGSKMQLTMQFEIRAGGVTISQKIKTDVDVKVVASEQQ